MNVFNFSFNFTFGISECNKGYFRNSTNAVDQCIPCPVGTYSDTGNAIACTDCPTGYTTSQEGSALCTGREIIDGPFRVSSFIDSE